MTLNAPVQSEPARRPRVAAGRVAVDPSSPPPPGKLIRLVADRPLPSFLPGFVARAIERRPAVRRMLKYALTSLSTMLLSEVVLLTLYGSGALSARPAAFVANLVSTLPSYLLSRYWIWRDAERDRVGLQVIAYWSISLVSLLASTEATGIAGHYAATTHDSLLRWALVGGAYLGTYAVLWLGKFSLYHFVLFRRRPATGAVAAVAADVVDPTA
jgi:putative flippase GtrA